MEQEHPSPVGLQGGKVEQFFLYPIITVHAEDEAEATDMVLEAIRGVGEIPGWLPEPPGRDEKRLNAAAPALLAALELALPVLRDQHAALAPNMHGGICPDREAIFAVEAAIAKVRRHDGRESG